MSKGIRTKLSLLVSAMLAVGLAAGLTTSASAGDPIAHAAGLKKCLKKAKKISDPVKRKKAKARCRARFAPPLPVTPPTTPTTPPSASLSISPTSFDFGNLNQQDPQNCQAPPDPDCPTQGFTITNAGPNASGVPAVSIAIVAADPGEPPAFSVFANTCTGPIAPGGSCAVTVRAHTPDNFNWVSRLDVSATPGGTASSTLMAQ